jgi:hypothetical protein
VGPRRRAFDKKRKLKRRKARIDQTMGVHHACEQNGRDA